MKATESSGMNMFATDTKMNMQIVVNESELPVVTNYKKFKDHH
jgi:hypothetical protein